MSDSQIMAALGELRTGLGELRNGLGDITSRLDRVESRLDRVEHGQNQMRVAIMDRIARLENRLTDQRDDTTVAMGAGERAERIAENTREILRINTDVLTTVTRKLQRLPTQVQELLDKKPDAGPAASTVRLGSVASHDGCFPRRSCGRMMLPETRSIARWTASLSPFWPRPPAWRRRLRNFPMTLRPPLNRR